MREIWRGELGGYPYWHDEGGNTVRVAPSSDGGINMWVTEQGHEDGPRLGTEDVRDMCAHLLALCDEQDAKHVPAAVTPEPAGPRVWADSDGDRWEQREDGLLYCLDDGNETNRARGNFVAVQLRYGPLTEVPAVPPAEPGAGAQ